MVGMMADATSPKLGLWLYPDAPASDLVDAIVRADEAGVDEIWVADEGVAREPFVLLAAAAQQTSRIRLGVGITSPALRHPGALAASAATLNELSDGRAMLGFGVGGHESLAPFGISVDRPVALVRDALRIARGVLSGRHAEGYEPPTHAAPPQGVPLFVGARGEQLNRLASREADGVFLSGFDHGDIAAAIGWARSASPVRIALYLSAFFRPGREPAGNALAGDPNDVAAEIALFVGRHRPDSIGIALVDSCPVADMVESGIGCLERLKAVLNDRG
jgi:alkanesulfonate monooxygenase SsuD/methylene tetrahydromethanopterin reductase-like flavin-dependent oxidoreductase (luciferase family)